ncbi:MAG: hypothetical protein K1X36_02905 [Pyrinomonadaceae bacterium]|nr:hypothetical protein [Pyrinomonadaceae bacterium]
MKLKVLFLSSVLIASAAIAGIAQTMSQPSISDSYWVGYDLDGVMTFNFEKGGILSYRYGGNSFRNGTWTQKGDVITFETNKRYRVFNGKLTDQTITGTSTNEADKTWETTMYRLDPPNCDPTSFIIAGTCKPIKSPKPAGKPSTKPKPKGR